MFSGFLPDHYRKDIYAITPEELQAEGIRGLICDIDNTLVTYDDPEPTPAVTAWIEAMRRSGIAVTFVSNNSSESRVERFNRPVGTYASAKSGKPFRTRRLREAMRYMQTAPETTAVVGDQIFTDIYAGKRLSMRSYLVLPIKDKTTLFFRFKRLLEIPVKRAYFAAHPEELETADWAPAKIKRKIKNR